MVSVNKSSAELRSEQLLGEAKHGNDVSLSELLNYDRDYLLLIAKAELDSGLVVKESHSDVVQASMLEAQQSFAGFRGESHTQWRQWLQTILKNNIKDLRRRYIDAEKRSIRREVNGTVTDHRHDPAADSPSRIAVKNEQIHQLEDFIGVLPEHYQHALHLRFWQQLSYDDMAHEMDSSAEAVRKVLYRAVEALVDVFKSQST